MGQMDRRLGADNGAYMENLRSRLNAIGAIGKLNDAITGLTDLSHTQFLSIKLAIDKCLPSLQAVLVEVQDNRPSSIHDLNAMLLSNGLDALPTDGDVLEHDPTEQAGQVVSERAKATHPVDQSGDNSQIAPEVIEGGTPPEVSE